jgi:beta-lactamase superfamily II metal-dependent hydrolase
VSVIYLLFLAVLGLVNLPSANAESICVPFYRLALRSGTESCWVRYPLSPNQSLCISHLNWIQWLNSEVAGSLCGAWSGKWRAYSPPVNHENERPKRTYLNFNSSALPDAGFYAPVHEKLRRAIERLREECSERLRPFDRLGIARRLLLDERGPDKPQSVLRSLGFVHLLTASGIHLYSIAIFSHQILILFAGTLNLSNSAGPMLARGLSFVLWLFMWILSGLRPGMLRPWIIVMLRTAGVSFGFRWKLLAPLVLSLAVDGILACYLAWVEPEAINFWAPGRWHYALAVGGGLLALQALKAPRSRRGRIFGFFAEHLSVAFGLAVGSWLFTAIWDAWTIGWVAASTPILSALTIPVCTWVLYPGLLGISILTIFDLPDAANVIARFAVGLATEMIDGLGKFVILMKWLWVVPAWALCLGSMGALWIVMTEGQKKIRCAVVLVVMILVVRVLAWAGNAIHVESIIHHLQGVTQEAIRVEQLDVGQGDATLVLGRAPESLNSHWAGMVDAGPRQALNEERWLKLFVSRQVTRLSWIALTHLDADHAGGVLTLAKVISIDCVATSAAELSTERGKAFVESLKPYRIPVMSWKEGCFPFPVLALKESGRHKKQNRNMSAVWIPLHSKRGYFSMGDADFIQEMQAVRWLSGILRFSDSKREMRSGVIVKISHHGSKTSTSSQFLRGVRDLGATESWISAGLGNSFGHPAPALLSRLEESGGVVFRTDRDGLLHSDQKSASISNQDVSGNP